VPVSELVLVSVPMSSSLPPAVVVVSSVVSASSLPTSVPPIVTTQPVKKGKSGASAGTVSFMAAMIHVSLAPDQRRRYSASA
jgi:hypothetical protein